MNTLCGIGLPELVILALLGFVLVGPDRSKDMAVKMGRFLRQVMTSEWWREFNQVSQAVKDLPTTLMRMAEIEETQAELRQVMTEIEIGTRVGLEGPLLKKPVPTSPTAAPSKPGDTQTGSVAEPKSATPDASQPLDVDSEGEATDV